MEYQLIDGSDCILNITEGLNIPNDQRNRHFQEYLTWLAEGNSPLPAEKKPVFPDYNTFWDELVKSNAYQESILPSSRKKIAANMSFTLFISAISDARSGRGNENHIQELLNQIVIDCKLTSKEVEEILNIIESNNIPLEISGGE